MLAAILEGGGGEHATSVAEFLRDVCLATVAAAVGGIVARLLRQPLMVGFLVAGVAVGPAAFDIVHDAHTIHLISEIGLLFLLFLIGLEIEPHRIFGKGLRPMLVGLAQVPICAVAAWAALGPLSLLLPGVLGELAQAPATRILLAIALAIPSAEIITKVLADRHELGTDAGRLTRAALGTKAVYVLGAFAVLPAFAETLDPSELWRTGVGALGELGVAALAGRFLLPLVFRLLWKSPELVLLTAIGWGFGLAAAAYHLHISMEIGALLAGMALSTHSIGESIAVRLRSLRDFFHTLFFVAIGMSLVRPSGENLVAIGAALGLVVATRFVGVAPLILFSGGGRRTAITSTLHLSQMSVFALVMITLAGHQGVLPDALAHQALTDVLTPVYAIAAVFSTYAIMFTPQIARAVERGTSTTMMAPARPILLLGFHRTGSSLLAALLQTRKHAERQVHVVDWNLDAYRELTRRGIAATYGDLSTAETLERASIHHARVIICTLEDDQLLGTDTRHIVRLARNLAPEARIIALASRRHEVKELHKAGADDVLAPRLVTAHELVPRILGLLDGQKPHPDPKWGDEVVP